MYELPLSRLLGNQASGISFYSDTQPRPGEITKNRLGTAACAMDYFPAGRSLYDLGMSDPTHLAQNLTEYFTAVMCLVLTFHCWRLDRQGRVGATTKASYVALVGLLLLIMALPSMGVV